ncbi:MAG: hypothetical protein IJJ85_07145 [Clostridia bacterium]|nr:hypothetical protein [Clostridia bacterium]
MSGSMTAYYYHSERFGGLPHSTLKIIAILTMFCDHYACVFLGLEMNFLRGVGRIAFPIFAFFIAEGALRSRNVPKYLLRLFLFALISEVPFDLAFNDGWFDMSYQNVFFTLFFGLFSIWCAQMFEKRNLQSLSLFTLLLSAAGAAALNTDYGAMGVIVIYLFYIFLCTPDYAKNVGFTLACLLLCIDVDFRFALHPGEIWAVFAVPLLFLYNGNKGRDVNKYFYYGFYPGHLLLLWGIYTLTH